MAKTIEHAEIVCPNNGAATQVTAHVRMPASEYAAFIVLAGLTNAVPAKDTTEIARVVAAGATG
ncbi:MAG: hypothetical protein NT062_10075 [Proteobacteria bacterium]|nr:hypothetical protein [Pseudomonadota bacterium]